MAGRILPLRHKEIKRNMELEMLAEMKKAGAARQIIVKVARGKSIPDEVVNKILAGYQE